MRCDADFVKELLSSILNVSDILTAYFINHIKLPFRTIFFNFGELNWKNR